jgi:hypothetical protein
MRSPGWSVSFAQLEKAPPAIRLTVTLSWFSEGRDAERIVAADILAGDVGPERQMLAGLEGEDRPQLVGHGEADRLGLGGLGDHLGDGEGVEMRVHVGVSGT